MLKKSTFPQDISPTISQSISLNRTSPVPVGPVGPGAADLKMTWRVADSCPCSSAHNKRSLLYPYGNIQQTGSVWREARSVPYGYCLKPVGERFHKSDTVTLYYIPRHYYEILECAPEDEIFS
jgi:hypothetical protein